MSSLPSTVMVGGLSKSSLLAKLNTHEVQLNQAAEDLFEDERFDTLTEEQEIPISAVSVAELGFPDGATYADLISNAQKLNLQECPLELGPHLRLQHLQQPEVSGQVANCGKAPTGSITIASAPLDDRDETPKGFYIRRVNSTLWLRGYRASACHVWSPEDILVFQRLRPSAK